MPHPKLSGPGSKVAILSTALVVVLTVTSVLVASARADYTINIGQGVVSVDITGDFVQGVPLPTINGTSFFALIPVFHANLQGTNASILSAALNDAVRAKTPSASATGVRFTADSNGTLMHYELAFSLNGISTTSNGRETMDLSWRSFAIAEDFGANGVSINRVVPNYLQSSIITQIQATGAPAGTQEVRTWYINRLPVQTSRVPYQTGNLLLFNFSSLSQPLTQWSTRRDFPQSQVVLQSRSGFNVSFIDRITEAEVTDYLSSDAVNNVNVQIRGPLPIQIRDNSLVFDTGQSVWRPQVMLASVGAGPAILVGTFIVERRVQPTLRPRRKRAQR